MQRRVPTVQTVQNTVGVPTGAVLGTVPPPGSGGVGFGPFSNLSRCTPSSSCVCHRVWLGYEHGFRRPSLERDVQLDVRVHKLQLRSSP